MVTVANRLPARLRLYKPYPSACQSVFFREKEALPLLEYC